MERKRRSFHIGIAIPTMERLTVPIVDALNGSGRSFDIAGAGGAYGNTPNIAPRLFAGRRHDGTYYVTSAKSSHYARLFRRFVGKSISIGAAHLPAMPPHRRDHQGN